MRVLHIVPFSFGCNVESGICFDIDKMILLWFDGKTLNTRSVLNSNYWRDRNWTHVHLPGKFFSPRISIPLE